MAYTGDVPNTDGYKIVASFLWRDISTVVKTDTTGTTIAKGEKVAMGTCVETLDYEGATLAAGTIDQGNFAICHWFYTYGEGTQETGTANTVNRTYWAKDGVAGVNWGETRIYTAYEWGNSGSGVRGANIQTNGVALDEKQGFALSHTALAGYTAGTIYSMSWFQPKYSASGYPANQLRRYSGGNFGTRADKVKAYSSSLRQLQDASGTDSLTFNYITAATQTGSAGTVTLSSAASLVAGLSFGIATLAF